MSAILDESTWQRARRDTVSAFHTWRFWLFQACAVAALGVLVLLWIPPPWQPPIAEDWVKPVYQVVVPLIGVFVGLGMVFLKSLFVAPYRQRNDVRHRVQCIQVQYDKLLANARFAIAFNGLSVTRLESTGETVSEGSIRIGVKLQNISNILIQYTMVEMKVVIDGKTVNNPTFLSKVVHVHSGKASTYFFPDICCIDLAQLVLSGTLEYTLEYSSVPHRYWFRSRRKLLIDIYAQPQRHAYRVQEEEESEISQSSSLDKEVSLS